MIVGPEHHGITGLVNLFGIEPAGDGIIALLEAFKSGVIHWFNRGEISLVDRDDLIAEADLIILGITLLDEEAVV